MRELKDELARAGRLLVVVRGGFAADCARAKRAGGRAWWMGRMRERGQRTSQLVICGQRSEHELGLTGNVVPKRRRVLILVLLDRRLALPDQEAEVEEVLDRLRERTRVDDKLEVRDPGLARLLEQVRDLYPDRVK